MRHASASKQANLVNEHPSLIKVWHMPDADLLCVKLRAVGFGEGFGNVMNRFVIGRCIVCRCPAKLDDTWKRVMDHAIHWSVPWNESQSDRQRM